ncbi:hypothetical protein Pav631_3771 [Pseudomonas avellanae BPIC 631]|nr:hypothetical protein Pav631_3771 [Pseudomonas avellanae BPIC 631]
MFSTMLEQVIEKAPAQASTMLLNFKEVNWHAMNSFVHSGIHPLRRHAEGYTAGLIESAVRSCNGLSLMVFQLGVVLTGDPRYKGVVRAIQEKYHQILPGLVSPL